MGRLRLILVGAVLGLTWAAALRGYMMQLADPTSTFTFSGTFGIILPAGVLAGALLGWAEYQRRAGRQPASLDDVFGSLTGHATGAGDNREGMRAA